MSHPVPLLNNEQLLQVLSSSNNAVAVHVAEDAIIQYASDRMIAIWGKDKSVIGKSLEQALPELKGQPFIDLFKKVWNEGVTISGTDTPAQLEVDGELHTYYFDFEYRAMKNDAGKTYCILHTATDVTERFLNMEKVQSLTEELRASNEELRAANEELNASNEELYESQQSLRDLYEDLAESDLRFRNMVKQAPVGICIIRARDLLIQDVNDSYLEIVGRRREELENHTIWDAIPEAAAAYAPVMNEVIRSGLTFRAREHEVVLTRNGVPETLYIDFVYEPVHNDGHVTTIMVLAIDVTDKVIARRSIEDVEERIRLAVEAAETGTFDLDLAKRIMLTSDRFNIIFGFDRQVPWEMFASVIHPDDKATRIAAHEAAIRSGKLFYEARVLHSDGSTHWVRVQGKVYYKDSKAVRILGTLLDITEFKRLQQQKDDFISIASHELKTPITSLKASLQLLERVKNDPASELIPKLIDQSSRSMHKISALVEDLLNVSRASKTELKLNKTPFTIAEMLDSCCSHVRIAGKHRLIVQGDMQLQVTADEHSIDQVVVNLVNNAVKYAPESKDIFMMVSREGEMAKIAVRDTGPGIAPEKITHLFDRYYRAESSGFQNSGLGLGLYICSEIIKRHGGDIGVESELGKGSTFWFTLPLY
ncbi:PAS domain-containing sensor histidine kinase [Mucilaginibacter flavidus]|uniref:PAS domain-containing sensor histidine kinase n=1 Tax=Mucilaginibacter flavidus TaxID=2949309 RepID=UPI002093CE91|nr:ATP-binding protein [Mucilaginibacter flavidus]MCO5950937.1 ATP-binding protein [Mucilaginibacter flavidus]